MAHGSWRLEDLQELEELGLASRLESTHRKGFGTDSATWTWSVRTQYVCVCVCAVAYPGGVYYSLEAAIFPFLKGEMVCGRSAI